MSEHEVEREATVRFLSAPLWADVDEASRRAILEVMKEERAPRGRCCSSKDGRTTGSGS